jgi:hypothetical protein
VLRSFRLLVQITAIVLLAWTAVDLSFPECCLSEPVASGSSAALDAHYGAPSPALPDIDDCFCCARCLDNGARMPRIDVDAVPAEFAEPLEPLATHASTLDHPPQLS